MSDLYLDQHLADLPELVTAHILAEKTGWGVQTVYQRAQRLKRNGDDSMLPVQLIIPGGTQLMFTRQAVIDWFKSVEQKRPALQKRPGRPKGSTSRRGVGREELEARS